LAELEDNNPGMGDLNNLSGWVHTFIFRLGFAAGTNRDYFIQLKISSKGELL